MKSRTPLNIAIIGYGFMGRAHSNAYRQVGPFFELAHEPVLKVACARNRSRLERFADNWGWAETETDWRQLVERSDIDLVDICTPNNSHREIAEAALAAGKMVACEKPLALNADEGASMVRAAERSGRPTMVWFNYRRVPAMALAKQLVDEGRVGRTYHLRSRWLQDWTISPDVPQGGEGLWRLERASAGSGVTGDLLAHSIDQAMWLNGPISSVTAVTETFVKERALQDEPQVRRPVEIDDAAAFLARFANGSIGTFEATRYARGRKNEDYLEINGEAGSFAFNFESPHQLEYYAHADDGHVRGWRTIRVWDDDHPYMAHWWVPGMTLGFEHTFVHQVADFLADLRDGTTTCPDFAVAQQTQVVCDAVLRSAAESSWVVIPVAAAD